MNREIKTNHAPPWARGLAAAFVLAVGLGAGFPVDAKKKPTSPAKRPAATKSVVVIPPENYPQCGAEYVADAYTGHVLHAHNAHDPVLPASVSKLPLALAVHQAVKSEQTRWDTEIDIPRPAPVVNKEVRKGKELPKPKINATICDDTVIGAHGTMRMSLRDALANTLVASNLYTSVGLARHLEGITGRPYPELVLPLLSAIGSDHSSIKEPSGISNAAQCLNERQRPADYAATLKDTIAKGARLDALKHNVSTVHDMARWAWAALKIPELVTILRTPSIRFMQGDFSNTNPLMRGHDPASADPGKTGFTVTAGGVFGGALGFDQSRPLMISVAACDNPRHRDTRLKMLEREFSPVTRQAPSPRHLDNPPQISHSHLAPGATQPALVAE